MTIETWLAGRMSKQEFVAHHYGRLPYSQGGGGDTLTQFGTWDFLGRVLAQPNADVMVVRRNQQYTGPAPVSGDQAERLASEGYTVLVRHAERHDQRLAELAAGFARDFAAPVNIHMYATPAEQFGFGWHYDCEEVFILQASGFKEYSLRKNTVNPWPLEETLPANMQYPREIMPLVRCTLGPGDWLYIPCGYWHKAEAHETAISLAVGVMAPAAIEWVDRLRAELLDSLLWRQRLPVVGDAAVLDDRQLEELFEQLARELAADVTKRLTNPALWRRWMAERRAEYGIADEPPGAP